MNKNMEGHVYSTLWKKRGKQFTLWLEDHPQIEATSNDFYDAKDQLCDSILKKFGDGEAVLQFEDNFPEDIFPVKYSVPRVLQLCGNECAYYSKNPELYTQGYCELCKKPVGKRTQIAAEFRSLPDHADSAVAENMGSIFSQEFFSHLTHEEKKSVEIVQVNCTKSKRIFYEIIGPSMAGIVGAKGFQGLHYGECKCCKTRSIYYQTPKSPFIQFLALKDLPTVLPSLFIIQNHTGPNLCMNAKRWKEIAGKKGTRNVVFRQLAIVPDSDLIRNPSISL